MKFSLRRTESLFQESFEGLELSGQFHFSAIKSILRKYISVQQLTKYFKELVVTEIHL